MISTKSCSSFHCYPRRRDAQLQHTMSFMVRGIFKHINVPMAYFPSNGFDSYQLYPCVWEAVRILESAGFKVRGLVSYGATPNRKFYRMYLHFEKDNQKDGVTYWTWNRYAPNRKLYFFSEPPHLVKTLRNNWENSNGHLNTRNLVLSNEIVMSSSNKFIQNSSKNEDFWFLYL